LNIELPLVRQLPIIWQISTIIAVLPSYRTKLQHSRIPDLTHGPLNLAISYKIGGGSSLSRDL